jgi:excisionase family DNA binding protein
LRGTHDSTRGSPKVPQVPPEQVTKAQDRPSAYLTVAEPSEELGISLRTAYYLISKDDIPHVRVGRSIRVYRDTLEEWRLQQEEVSKKKAPSRRKVEASDLARERHARQRKAYRNQNNVEPDHHHANAGADGWTEDLHPHDAESEVQEVADAPAVPELSELARAVRDYLDRNPGDACQPPGWIGSTLWAYDLLHSDKSPPATPAEIRSAIEELGGETYLRDKLELSRGAA